MNEDAPVQTELSVVVAIVSDTTRSGHGVSPLEGALEALAQQVDPPSMEVIVPHVAGFAGIERLQRRFPKATFFACTPPEYVESGSGREHHDVLRAEGIARARGRIVALIEDLGRPDPNWTANLVKAFEPGVTGVGGAIENDISRSLNWAVYFCDFGFYQNPVPAGTAWTISDANGAYIRAALESIADVWRQKFNQVSVNQALLERGAKLVLSGTVILHQHRAGLRFGEALKERFVWGRSYGASRCQWLGGVSRIARLGLSPLLPFILVVRMAATVAKKGRCRAPFLRALPLIILLSGSWAAGEVSGYWTGTAKADRSTRKSAD